MANKPATIPTQDTMITKTIDLLTERGYADAEFMTRYTPEQIIGVCNAWAKRVGVLSRGSAAVSVATSTRYPALLSRLLSEDLTRGGERRDGDEGGTCDVGRVVLPAWAAEAQEAVPETAEPPLCECGKHYVGATCGKEAR